MPIRSMLGAHPHANAVTFSEPLAQCVAQCCACTEACRICAETCRACEQACHAAMATVH